MALYQFVLSKEDFEVDKGKLLGRGDYGSVYEGTDKRNGRRMIVAVKEPLDEATFKSMKSNLRELDMICRLDHPGCIKLVGFYIPPDVKQGPTILTPLMRNGGADKMIKKELDGTPDPRWDGLAKSCFVFGVAAAMAYLHSQGILHRDLRPKNVFLNDKLEPVIADFGLARVFDINMTMAVGTPLFMAPELWLDGYDDQYTGAVDVYAYGVTLFQLFSNSEILDDNAKRPYPQQLIMRVMRGARLKRPDGKIPDFYWDLITSCWAQNPDLRPDFCKIIPRLQANRELYAFPGTDIAALKAYEERVLQGVELVDRTVGPPPQAVVDIPCTD